MPIYRYKCEKCDFYRDCWNSVINPTPVPCSQCGDLDMTKVPHGDLAINWNGRKPSDGGVTDYVRSLEDYAPRKRDELDEVRGL